MFVCNWHPIQLLSLKSCGIQLYFILRLYLYMMHSLVGPGFGYLTFISHHAKTFSNILHVFSHIFKIPKETTTYVFNFIFQTIVQSFRKFSFLPFSAIHVLCILSAVC